jgi:hypothetical protein
MDEILQQGGLPDPCLASQHERTTLASADRRDQLVEERTLLFPAHEPVPLGGPLPMVVRAHEVRPE